MPPAPRISFFEKAVIKTSKGDEITLIDGGYCANNLSWSKLNWCKMNLSVPQSNDILALQIRSL